MEAAALGKGRLKPNSFFPFWFGALGDAKPKGKKGGILAAQPRAALRLPWANIISSLWDFSLARSARIISERKAWRHAAHGNHHKTETLSARPW